MGYPAKACAISRLAPLPDPPARSFACSSCSARDLNARYAKTEALNVDERIDSCRPLHLDLPRGAASVISNLQRTADNGEPITLTQLDQKRQLIGRDAAGTPADKFFGSQMRNSIDDFINDDFINNAGPEHMVGAAPPPPAPAAPFRKSPKPHEVA